MSLPCHQLPWHAGRTTGSAVMCHRGSEPPQHGCSHSAQICFILASFLSPSGGGRAGGPGGIHPKWASISFLYLWALRQAELQAVTLQTVINHKLWAVLKCLPCNLLVHRKSEMLLIGFQQLSPFLARIYLICHSDNTVDYSPEHSLDPSCVSLDL